jgi:ATP-binding protein involved in chromosome partitioning
MPTREDVLEALKSVIDPELKKDVVELGMVRSIAISDGGEVAVTVSLTTAGCPIRNHFVEAVQREAGSVAGVTKVDVSFDVLSD